MMIMGHLDNLATDLYGYPAALTKALKFLAAQDCARLADGRHNIDGDDVFALVQRYQTRDKVDCRPETHVEYLDIQYVAAGSEEIGVTPLTPDLKVTEDNLAERDVRFYGDVPPETTVVLRPGVYAILYPSDVHRPCCSSGAKAAVTKVVVKIRVAALK